jgi:hypothetical protein
MFEVLTAGDIKNTVYFDVTPYGLAYTDTNVSEDPVESVFKDVCKSLRKYTMSHP